MQIKLTLPLPPSANRYWRKGGGGVLYVSEEARKYKEIVWICKAVKNPFLKDVEITVKVFRARKSGDLDNKLKVLFDALQGVIYKNDSQITVIHAFRFDDAKNPRVEIEVKEL